MSKTRKDYLSLPNEDKNKMTDKICNINNNKNKLAILYNNYREQGSHLKLASFCKIS